MMTAQPATYTPHAKQTLRGENPYGKAFLWEFPRCSVSIEGIGCYSVQHANTFGGNQNRKQTQSSSSSTEMGRDGPCRCGMHDMRAAVYCAYYNDAPAGGCSENSANEV